MKIRKLILSILSILSIFIFSTTVMSSNVSAKEPVPKDIFSTQTVIINEYDALKEMESQSELSLKERGLSISEIQTAKNSISLMTKDVQEKSKLTVDELKSMGYNDKQINVIKNFKGTEAELRAASGEMTLTLNLYNYIHNSVETSCNLQLRWQWSSAPLQQFNDGIAIAWNRSFNSNQAKTYANLYYKDAVNGTTKIIENRNVTFSPGAGFKLVFPLTDVYNAGPYAKCLEGYAYTQIYTDSDIQAFEVLAAYGHTYLKVDPSIDIEGTPSISIGWATSDMGQIKREVRKGVLVP